MHGMNSKRRVVGSAPSTETGSVSCARRSIRRAVWISACLTISCVSCAPRIVAMPPPAALTQDCPIPVLEGETYRDAIVLAERRAQALQECSARMRALRRLGREE